MKKKNDSAALMLLQKQLDTEKYNRGLQNNIDNSGNMWYCENCKHKCNIGCDITHEQRVKDSICAENYIKTYK